MTAHTPHPYVVIYRTYDHPACDPPLVFACAAEDVDHAEEQCQDAEPGAEIAWVVATERPEIALADYYAGWEAEP
jgi:hypothetical protein